MKWMTFLRCLSENKKTCSFRCGCAQLVSGPSRHISSYTVSPIIGFGHYCIGFVDNLLPAGFLARQTKSSTMTTTARCHFPQEREFSISEFFLFSGQGATCTRQPTMANSPFTLYQASNVTFKFMPPSCQKDFVMHHWFLQLISSEMHLLCTVSLLHQSFWVQFIS